MTRILVCGGRNYEDYELVRKTLDEICVKRNWMREPDEYGNTLPIVTIIHGGATGADALADQWAVVNRCPIMEFKANWKEYGKAAGPIRNKEMLGHGRPELVVAFPGGRGTADMVRQARSAGVEVIEVVQTTIGITQNVYDGYRRG